LFASNTPVQLLTVYTEHECYNAQRYRRTDGHYGDQQTLNPDDDYTFCLINVSGCSTYSSVHCRWQSVFCYSRSSMEQSAPFPLHLLLSS